MTAHRTPLMALALMAFLGLAPAAFADSMMEKSTDSMEKMDKMEKISGDSMMMDHQIHYSADAFAAAQASGKTFLVAFHKDGCPDCIKQQGALDAVYKDPAHSGLQTLVVNYLKDTASLKKFNVGRQTTLIVFKGADEITRKEGALTKDSILSLLNTKPAMMNP